MKSLLAALLALSVCAHAAHAESFARAATRIARQTAVAPERLTSPNLRLIAGGQLIHPDQVVPDAVAANASLVSRSGDVPTQIASAEHNVFTAGRQAVAAYALPVQFAGFTKAAAGVPARPVEFEPVVLVLNALRFQPGTRRFEANLVVGLRNRAAPRDQSTLAESVRLLLQSNVDEISPAEIVINKLGEPQAVRVAAVSPSNPVRVVAATLLDQGDAVEIPVVRPSLLVGAARGTINGLGLEKTTLHVQSDNIGDVEGLRVFVSATQGDVRPSEIVLDAQGRGTAELRSAGLGAVTLQFTGAPFETGKTVVEFGKPWSSLIAGALGAVVGWILRMQRRKKTAGSVVIAIASAAFVLAGYSIGIRLAQWAPDASVGEALVFFVAAVGAYWGVRALAPIPKPA